MTVTWEFHSTCSRTHQTRLANIQCMQLYTAIWIMPKNTAIAKRDGVALFAMVWITRIINATTPVCHPTRKTTRCYQQTELSHSILRGK